MSIVCVAPQRRATSRRAAGPPITMIFEGPLRAATAVENSPSGPEPWITSAWRSSSRPRRSKPCTTVRSAQAAAEASSSGTMSGTFTRPELG